MDTNSRSVMQQIAAGTYDRNEMIRFMHKRIRNCAAVGRLQNPPLTRQAIRKIISEASDGTNHA